MVDADERITVRPFAHDDPRAGEQVDGRRDRLAAEVTAEARDVARIGGVIR